MFHTLILIRLHTRDVLEPSKITENKYVTFKFWFSKESFSFGDLISIFISRGHSKWHNYFYPIEHAIVVNSDLSGITHK